MHPIHWRSSLILIQVTNVKIHFRSKCIVSSFHLLWFTLVFCIFYRYLKWWKKYTRNYEKTMLNSPIPFACCNNREPRFMIIIVAISSPCHICTSKHTEWQHYPCSANGYLCFSSSYIKNYRERERDYYAFLRGTYLYVLHKVDHLTNMFH